MDDKMTTYGEAIDLKSLCIFIARKWRIIVCCVLICTIVFGVFKVVAAPEVKIDTEREEEIQELLSDNGKLLTAAEEDLKDL